MTTLTQHIRSLTLAGAGLFVATGAFAQGTWDLDACVRAVSGACTSGGSTVSVSGFYANASNTNFVAGTLNVGSDWMGVNSRNSSGTAESTTNQPHHAIDNYSSAGASYAEGVYLNFNKAVDLSAIAAVWVYNPGDGGGTTGHGNFEVWRWNGGSTGPGAITGYQAGSMTGWTSVSLSNNDFGSGLSKTITDNTFYSSHWLVTTKFGGNDDAFKLGTVNASNVCAGTPTSGGLCTPPPGNTVPEPASLALLALAALGAGAARRRVQARRA